MSRYRNQRRYETAEEIPLENRRLVNFTGPIKAIGDTVLEHKKDIKFHRGAETMRGAQKYARRHNLIPIEEDINGDQIPDVILYNKYGEPVMVNGWGVAPSQYPYRKTYKDLYEEDEEGRIKIGGYKGFMKKLRRGQTDNVALGDIEEIYKNKGFVLKKRIDPEKEQASNEHNTYKRFFEMFRRIFTNIINQSDPYKWAVRLISQLQLSNLIYIRLFLYNLWNSQIPDIVRERRRIEEKHPDNAEKRCEEFRASLRKKAFKNIAYEFFTENRQTLLSDLEREVPRFIDIIGYDSELQNRLRDMNATDDIMSLPSEPEEEIRKKILRKEVRDRLNSGAATARLYLVNLVFDPEANPDAELLRPAPEVPSLQLQPETRRPIVYETTPEEDPQGW